MKTAETAPISRPSYLKFFWPLSLMGIVMMSGRLIQNYVLLRFENGVNELAWFALAMALYGPFQSVIVMAPNMVTVWAKSSRSRRKTFDFITLVCMGISLPLFIVAFSPVGPVLVITGLFFLFRVTPLSRLFLIYLQQCTEPLLLRNARDCIWVLMASPLAVTFRNYYHGLAMVHHRTWAMGAGGLARNGIILLSGAIFLCTQTLSHLTASAMIVLAFLAEGIAVMLLTRSWRKLMDI